MMHVLAGAGGVAKRQGSGAQSHNPRFDSWRRLRSPLPAGRPSLPPCGVVSILGGVLH